MQNDEIKMNIVLYTLRIICNTLLLVDAQPLSNNKYPFGCIAVKNSI